MSQRFCALVHPTRTNLRFLTTKLLDSAYYQHVDVWNYLPSEVISKGKQLQLLELPADGKVEVSCVLQKPIDYCAASNEDSTEHQQERELDKRGIRQIDCSD